MGILGQVWSGLVWSGISYVALPFWLKKALLIGKAQ